MSKTCSVENCSNKHSAKGYCNKHYQQMLKHGRIIDENIKEKRVETCLVDNCDNKHLAKGYCSKHYAQFKKYGHVLERTVHDSNEIIEYEDYAELILYNKECKEIARAIIDLEDVDNIKIYKWYMNPSGYIINRGKNIGFLHRFIMDCPDDLVVDHINHNPLDNRKENLRICTQEQNMCNQSIRKDNKSGCPGVYYVERKSKWVAQIRINKKTKHLGYFNTIEEAIEARRQAEIEYFGEFAPTRE